MRSFHPDPRNLWSHGLVLTVKDDSHRLLELLWIRGERYRVALGLFH